MKKLIFGTLILITLFSCKKEKCVSCIAESISGKIMDYKVACNTDNSYLKGYVDGLTKYYKDNGDSVVVRCVNSN